MADLTTNFIGIKSPNPFWLASAPPTDKEYNVRRAFEAGWGGVVWKTLGSEGPPVVNVNGPRYGAIWGADRRLLGLNNIELITDRPLEVNLREITSVKRDYPDRAVVVSLMVPCEEAAWAAILPLVEHTGADGIELNCGCPHGMSERGMGAAGEQQRLRGARAGADQHALVLARGADDINSVADELLAHGHEHQLLAERRQELGARRLGQRHG